MSTQINNREMPKITLKNVWLQMKTTPLLPNVKMDFSERVLGSLNAWKTSIFTHLIYPWYFIIRHTIYICICFFCDTSITTMLINTPSGYMEFCKCNLNDVTSNWIKCTCIATISEKQFDIALGPNGSTSLSLRHCGLYYNIPYIQDYSDPQWYIQAKLICTTLQVLSLWNGDLYRNFWNVVKDVLC